MAVAWAGSMRQTSAPQLLGGLLFAMATPHSDGSVPIPRIDPSEWESHQGFRETLLLHFSEPNTNTALRKLGVLLFDLVLESSNSWPDWPEGTTRAELRAAVAD